MKAEVGKLYINKLVNAATSLNKLKTKVDDLDVGILKTVRVEFKKIEWCIRQSEDVENRKFNIIKTKVNNLKKKTPDATTIIHINWYNTDKQNLERKKWRYWQKNPDTSGLVTTIVLKTKISDPEKKISNTTSLVTTTVLNTKIGEVENS